MPSSRQARMTRTAISPRFATRMRLKSARKAGSEWNIAMLLGRVPVALVLQHLERADEARAGVGGLDDLVDVAELGRLVRVGEGAPVVGDQRSRSAAGSLARSISFRKMMLTAPSGPMTAISAVG